jgi:hypothetical protein
MDGQNNKSCQAGKGDRPRNCFSNKYRNNYDLINWKKKESTNNEKAINNTVITNK